MGVDPFGLVERGVLFVLEEHVEAWCNKKPPLILPGTVKKVRVFRCENPDHVLRKISDVWGAQIKELQIVQCQGLATLDGCAFTNLQRFELGDALEYTDRLFTNLEATCKQSLRDVSVWNCLQLTAINGQFPNLQRVFLQGTLLDNKGLERLSQTNSKTLRFLNIDCTAVSKIDVAKLFINLEQFEASGLDLEERQFPRIKKSTCCKEITKKLKHMFM